MTFITYPDDNKGDPDGDSRDLDDLHPIVERMARDFIARANRAGINILVTSTYRSIEVQNELFKRGRSILFENGRKVPIVTNARGGQSFHNYRLAFDVVPLRNGKPVWGTSGADALLWARVGALGEAAGLEWAGRWRRFKEMAHFQFTGGHPLAYYQEGGKL
jgi:peptidoglycan LD-endopeptidase CwlK